MRNITEAASNLIKTLPSDSLFDKFKIPTLLGFAIIILGIFAGVILVSSKQIFISKASPDIAPQNVTVSNLSDTEATISYQTSTPVTSFINFGQITPNEQTILEDKDLSQADEQNPSSGAKPQPRLVHYITLKNLLPKTTYQYKIITGKKLGEIQNLTTASPLNSQVGFRPIIGSVIDKDSPLTEGVVYLSIAGATTQSAQIKASGNFLIPVSQIRKDDLTDTYSLTDDTLAKLIVISNSGSASALFKFKISGNTLPPLELGRDVDLTNFLEPTPKPASPSAQELNEQSSSTNKFDLNGDGRVNATDNAIILQNFGSKPKNNKADLNNDGKVDQKDLDLMAKQINQ
ncbi:hypothetical protein HYW41_04510 [Candidatus Daviesbacteria bacterium]|nr:hypothetical protein [Candidatus Daviesbacteria bacterium]